MDKCCVCGIEEHIFTQKCGHKQCQDCYTKGLCFGHEKCPICRVVLIPEFEDEAPSTGLPPMCAYSLFFAPLGQKCTPLVGEQCACCPAPYQTYADLMRENGMEEEDIPTEYDYTVESLRRMRRGFRTFRKFLSDEHSVQWKPKIPNNKCNPHCHSNCHTNNLYRAFTAYKDIINFTDYSKNYTVKPRAAKRQRKNK